MLIPKLTVVVLVSGTWVLSALVVNGVRLEVVAVLVEVYPTEPLTIIEPFVSCAKDAELKNGITINKNAFFITEPLTKLSFLVLFLLPLLLHS